MGLVPGAWGFQLLKRSHSLTFWVCVGKLGLQMGGDGEFLDSAVAWFGVGGECTVLILRVLHSSPMVPDPEVESESREFQAQAQAPAAAFALCRFHPTGAFLTQDTFLGGQQRDLPAKTWEAFWVLIFFLSSFRRPKKAFLKGVRRQQARRARGLRGFDRAGPWKVCKAQPVASAKHRLSHPLQETQKLQQTSAGSKPVVKWACFLGCAGTSCSLPESVLEKESAAAHRIGVESSIPEGIGESQKRGAPQESRRNTT